MKNANSLLLNCLGFLILNSCCGLVITSEVTYYHGSLDPKIADTTTEIYADNLNLGVFENGVITPGWRPAHPDTNGYFLVSGTTPSHDECEHPSHWDNGPFEIFIRGPNIQDYHDTLSVEEMKAFPQLNADSLGIKRKNNDIWGLPEIVLIPK